MFFTLFMKECKEMLRSITYYIFIIALVCFYLTQMGAFIGITKPMPDQDSYGTKYSDDPDKIMKDTMILLMGEYCENSYVTYPVGFYKEVHLNGEKQQKVLDIMDKLLVADKEELTKMQEGKSSKSYEDLAVFNEEITYEEFAKDMTSIDLVLGKGSKYATDSLECNSETELTYEEALQEYEDIVEKDQVSRAYARLFCDYMGIILAILPVFLAVTRVHRDKRAKAVEVIYTKKSSSAVIVLSRYFAIVCMTLLPVILLSISPALQTIYCAKSNGVNGDWLVFPQLIAGWLLPTILITISLGFLVSELTQGPLAILIQGGWWFVSVFMGMGKMVGGVGMNLIPRFNTFGESSEYVQMIPQLIRNRLFYSAFAILLLLVTILLYDKKRKGVQLFNGTLSLHRKG